MNVIDPRGISVMSDLDGNILWYYDNTADAGWKGYAFPIKPLKNLSPSSRALRPPGHPERSEGSVSQYRLDKYPFWGGNVMQLPNGHVEICASEPRKIGTPRPPSDLPSHVLELANGPGGPEIVWQMKVAQGGTYRSYRIPSLYSG